MITVLKIVVGMLVIGFGIMALMYWIVDTVLDYLEGLDDTEES